MNGNSRDWLLGSGREPDVNDFSAETAWNDHKIRFVTLHCRGRDVLDLGCVQHNPENYKSKYWLHKAIAQVAKTLEGMDLYAEGVEYLNEQGYSVSVGDAESFSLGKTYDVIVAGDLIEHLGNPGEFLESCKSHLRPQGKLLISTPNPWYWRFMAKAFLFGGCVNPNPEHVLWMCPVVLAQLAARHDMKVENWHYGSRYWKDRLVPLPKAVKHTSFHAILINE